MAVIEYLTKSKDGSVRCSWQSEGAHLIPSQWEGMLAGHMAPVVRKQHDERQCSLYPSPYSAQAPSPPNVVTHIQEGSSHLSGPRPEVPHRHSQKFISPAILQAVGLAAILNYHRFPSSQPSPEPDGMSISFVGDFFFFFYGLVSHFWDLVSVVFIGL